MDLGLADKVCLVTGSTGGIGLETVELLRAEGADVVATGRSGGDIRADLSRPGEPERVVREVEERFGRIDVLVNNVGGTDIRKLEDLTDADWRGPLAVELSRCGPAAPAPAPGPPRPP